MAHVLATLRRGPNVSQPRLTQIHQLDHYSTCVPRLKLRGNKDKQPLSFDPEIERTL
ncbi:hypothetical protein PIB30_091147, partial [Stylosanthes scabra]|nr:hypothetical protein [Stylosanthes scabra]